MFAQVGKWLICLEMFKHKIGKQPIPKTAQIRKLKQWLDNYIFNLIL